jgi:hypothetical protein
MKIRVVYWVATSLLAALYLAGGAWYLSDIAGVQKTIVTFGYPAYLVPLLGTAKLAGALTILTRFSVKLSDLAYAGMFFHLLLAASAHINVGDHGFGPALVGLVALFISFITQNDARKKPSPYLRSSG